MISKNLELFIKDLSATDKKTLTQKTAKLFEEGGELSKKVLGYDGIYGTNHRMVTKEDILEELVDIYLVNTSMLHDLGISNDDFENKLFEKAQIWQNLQVKEDRASANGDLMAYEIHITLNDPEGINIDLFKHDCKIIGVKPILLALQDQKGNKVMNDIMTSSKIYGTNSKAIVEMDRISNELTECGYTVIRKKIEAAFYHQKAPFSADGDTEMPESCYFECHFNVGCTDEKLQQLSTIADNTDCHLSTNAFKTFGDGSFTIMMTYRSYTQMYEEFERQLDKIKSCLIAKAFNIEKEIVEFSIYDTKISHDKKWLDA